MRAFLEAQRYSTYSNRKLVPRALITQAVQIIDFANHYISQGIVFKTTDVLKGTRQREDTTWMWNNYSSFAGFLY